MARQYRPGHVRLKYMALNTQPVVGMLYRNGMCGRMVQVVAVAGTAVTVRSYGTQWHGAITPSKRPRNTVLRFNGAALQSGLAGYTGGIAYTPVAPYVVA